MNQLTNLLINQLTKKMQNEPNSYHGLPARGSSLSTCNISGYVTFQPFELQENRRKNEAKRTQNEPNFSSKLGSFFKYWLCFSLKSAVKRYPKELFCGLRRLCGYELSRNLLKKALKNYTLYYRVLCIITITI